MIFTSPEAIFRRRPMACEYLLVFSVLNPLSLPSRTRSHRRLILTFAPFSSRHPSRLLPPTLPPGKDSAPIYEIYASPSGDSPDSKNSRVASLEQRIARLEATLGSNGANSEKLAMLKAENRADGLLEAVEELQTKVNLLNPKVVDLVDGRLGALQLRLQQIGEKKAANAAAGGAGAGAQQLTEETAKRIEEIHGQMEKWESVCATLPNIADRMATLNDLHNRASTFSQTLQQLEAMQKTISGNLSTQSSLVNTVEATLAENLETIGKNCKALDERIAKLKK